jgi:flavodoxin
MNRILVLYDSRSGNVAKMAQLVAEGAGSLGGGLGLGVHHSGRVGKNSALCSRQNALWVSNISNRTRSKFSFMSVP